MIFASQILLLQTSGSDAFEAGKMFGQFLFVVFVIGAIIIGIKNSRKPK
jgi:hypothetical protein